MVDLNHFQWWMQEKFNISHDDVMMSSSLTCNWNILKATYRRCKVRNCSIANCSQTVANFATSCYAVQKIVRKCLPSKFTPMHFSWMRRRGRNLGMFSCSRRLLKKFHQNCFLLKNWLLPWIENWIFFIGLFSFWWIFKIKILFKNLVRSPVRLQNSLAIVAKQE